MRGSLPALLPALLLLGCTWGRSSDTSPETHRGDTVEHPARTVILVSIDGLRPDHMDPIDTPALDAIAAGVRADSLQPPFPSFTFPSHYTLVTGLHPEDHGIVSNVFFDPERGAQFKLGDPGDMTDGRWWDGEPIWNTAERQGVRSATMFWPGSEARIGGRQPSDWVPYNSGMAKSDRVDRVLGWLDRDATTRPGFITLYFSDVDSAGHRSGPLSDDADAALRRVDTAMGRLLQGLDDRDLRDDVDLVVVSDHGMAFKDPDKVVFLDDVIDLNMVRVAEWSPLLQIHGADERAPAIAEAIGELEHVTCATRQTTPAEWHYRDDPAIGDVVCLADNGWSLTQRGYYEANPDRFTGGTHGWDPTWTAMHGVFLADGPQIRDGARIETIHAVDVYNVLAALLDIEPATNAGDTEVVDRVVAGPRTD